MDCVFFPENTNIINHRRFFQVPRTNLYELWTDRWQTKNTPLSGERFVTREPRNCRAWKRIQTWWERRLRLIRFQKLSVGKRKGGRKGGCPIGWLAMGRKHKRRLIPEQDRRICGSICFCQFTIVISCVALVYLSVAIYMPSHR